MAVSNQLCLAIPATSGALPTARTALRSWLWQAGIDHRTAAEVLVAVWEACANAVEHPVGPTSAQVVLKAEAADDALSVSVRDSGRWQPPRKTTTRGLGLTLVRSLMDDVRIDRRPDGTEVRMTRRLRPRNGRAPGDASTRRAGDTSPALA